MSKMAKTITATILRVLPKMTSHHGGYTYFVIKLVTDTGERYDVSPSDNTKEYVLWEKLIEKYGTGKKFAGFQYAGESPNNGSYCHKQVLPTLVLIDEEWKEVEII